jgi:hypothetical protein
MLRLGAAARRSFLGTSVHALTREAVASLPELADGAPRTLIVDAFLMRAADDAVGHGDGPHAVLRYEIQHFLGDAGVVAHVAGVEFPVAHLADLLVLGRNNTDNDLAGAGRIRAVEGDGRCRPPAHALLGFLAQAFEEAIRHEVTLKVCALPKFNYATQNMKV